MLMQKLHGKFVIKTRIQKEKNNVKLMKCKLKVHIDVQPTNLIRLFSKLLKKTVKKNSKF